MRNSYKTGKCVPVNSMRHVALATSHAIVSDISPEITRDTPAMSQIALAIILHFSATDPETSQNWHVRSHMCLGVCGNAHGRA